ncbi:MAG: elongation factor P hydroxylase [Gammaproteobacteria bacterium]|nr:elongation factor P hydroxylase [Gammaproteobacteria bacterium]MBK6582010.1 elongation factor P hydroxylase [Gammaproteobacteria bacterium]MBK7170315.1 elongation factor P hydroxylase [Gammaproteobacteria bacterium]MBK7521730.1 elongation factor P hydroxylase [Gammaproteobacteria bacterium]MBK7728246.1 elongation factor P hydroxylase [Gammaproteobacteria bacterium]
MASTATASASRAEGPAPGVAAPDARQLCALFDELFGASENTCLVAGGEEPLYVPADCAHARARIIFRHDYVASALHEIAHWCIAGSARRRELDYGYWYTPDGRDALRQAEFERLEARPQALEWLLSEACGAVFRPSIDNLGGAAHDPGAFVHAIAAAARDYCVRGMPPRARLFHAALCRWRGGQAAPDAAHYVATRLLAADSCQ